MSSHPFDVSMILSRCAANLTLVVIACLVVAGCGTPGLEQGLPDAGSEAGGPPRLLLVVAVDQLIAERLDPALPGGLGRLAREGRVFVDAAHEHARSETCPGHVVMLTGVHPGRAGIPGNRFIVNGTGEVRYCVQDDDPEGRVLTMSNELDPSVIDGAAAGAGKGRSPKQIRVDALGDWMKSRWPESKVFTVSAKDRAAIALGGQHPDVAWWLDRGGSGAFTTSAYYLDALPDWAAAWRRERVLEGLPREWDYSEQTSFGDEIREDDYAHESDRFSRTAPHPLLDGDPAVASLSPVEASPYLDTKTLEFTRELARRERLGQDDVPDLLGISFSATDIVGHHYGPYSREAWVALQQLDRDLGVLLSELEATAGPGGLLVALTSDHGVLPIPEWWQARAEAGERCPVAGGRVDPAPIEGALAEALVEAFGEDWARGWVRDGMTFDFDAALAERDGVTFEMAVAVARTALASNDAISRVWTRAEIEAAGDDDHLAMLYRNQLADGRGGQFFAEPAAGCLFTRWPSGTSHGSPHAYDLDVPLVFWGPGVDAARVPGRAAPVDIAPTLARLIGLEAPEGLDGQPLRTTGAP